MMKNKESMVTSMKREHPIFLSYSSWPLAFTPEQEEQNRLDCLEIERKEGFDEGSKEGFEKGLREARILLMNQMKLKYGSDEEDWIKTLTTEQINLLSKSMFTNDTLDELKNKIKQS